MKSFLRVYARFSEWLHRSGQFAQSGWRNLHHPNQITCFFAVLSITSPAVNVFQFASAVALVFGAGLFSIDALLVARCRARI